MPKCSGQQEIEITQIHTKRNYRQTFNEKSLKELSQSVKKNGVIQPIILRKNDNGYELIAGERRFRAAKMAGLVTIPAVVREVSDTDVLKLQLIENVQREGVPYMEEAYAVERLRDECSLDVHEIAQMLGKSELYVYTNLQLTRMVSEAQEAAIDGCISKTVAVLIARLEDEDLQRRATKALSRKKKIDLISEKRAKEYIAEQLSPDRTRYVRKSSLPKEGGKEFIANWKKYLLTFNCQQFEAFKKLARGRIETEILAEAVDCVMRERVSEQNA